MNSIQLIGRLTRDPELRSTRSGKPVAAMRLAVSRRDREAAPVYVDVVAYDKLGEVAAEHLVKGQQVAISGRLDYQEWEHEGSKRSKHEVVASEVDFLARPQAEGQDQS